MITTRQQATLDLIKANSLQGKTTTQREIYQNYPYDKDDRADGYIWNDNLAVHDHCSMVWKDIVDINFDKDSEIIIAKDFTYEIAKTPLEATKFALGYKNKGIRQFMRYVAIMTKIKANGQYHYDEDFNELKVFEAFLQEQQKE